MSSATHSVHINPLSLENTIHLECKPSEVSKADNRYTVARVNPDYVGQFSLNRWNNRTTQNHHN